MCECVGGCMGSQYLRCVSGYVGLSDRFSLGIRSS